jgi:glycerol transport system ATP-binding protein
VLACDVKNGHAYIAGQKIATANKAHAKAGKSEIGVRPEFVKFARQGLEARVVKVSDAGRFSVVEADSAGGRIRLLVEEGGAIPSESAHLEFDPEATRIYTDGWLAGREGQP